MYVKYVLLKENKSLLKQNAIMEYVQNVLNNYLKKINNFVQYVDKQNGLQFNIKKLKMKNELNYFILNINGLKINII